MKKIIVLKIFVCLYVFVVYVTYFLETNWLVHLITSLNVILNEKIKDVSFVYG
jgi:hypothetical protein